MLLKNLTLTHSSPGGQIKDISYDERDFHDEFIDTIPPSSSSSPSYPNSVRESTNTAIPPRTYKHFNAIILPTHGLAFAIAQVTPTIINLSDQNMILDDELHRILVEPLPTGCKLTALVDACHSGSVLDLPYQYAIRSDYGRPKHRGPGDATKHFLAQSRTAVDRAEGRLSQLHVSWFPVAMPLRWCVRRSGNLVDVLAKAANTHVAQAVFDGTEALCMWKHSQDAKCGMRRHLKVARKNESLRETKAVAVSCLRKGSITLTKTYLQILISGCSDATLSEEGTMNGTKAGVLTWAFLETLRACLSLSTHVYPVLIVLHNRGRRTCFVIGVKAHEER